MTVAECNAIEAAGLVCEYWLGVAAEAARRGRVFAAQDAREWAALASTSAFFFAESSR